MGEKFIGKVIFTLKIFHKERITLCLKIISIKLFRTIFLFVCEEIVGK